MKYEKQKYLLKQAIKDTLGDVYWLKYVYIAGGAVRSVFAGEPIRDLDLYFYDYPLKIDLPEKKFEIIIQTETADTWRNTENGKIFQIIKKFYGRPEDIMKKFDFTISMGAYLPRVDEFILDDRFLYHLAERRLVFNIETDYPISSVWRMKRFLSKGYRIGAVDLITLCLRVHNLKIKTFEDLKKQLDGIDTALLKPLTDKLVEEKGDKEYDLMEFLEYMEKTLGKIWKDG